MHYRRSLPRLARLARGQCGDQRSAGLRCDVGARVAADHIGRLSMGTAVIA